MSDTWQETKYVIPPLPPLPPQAGPVRELADAARAWENAGDELAMLLKAVRERLEAVWPDPKTMPQELFDEQ